MDRVEKMLGRMKASKLYRCVDWDPEGKAKDLVDKFNSASRSETMTRTGEYLGKLFAHMGKECYIEPPFYWTMEPIYTWEIISMQIQG